MDFKVITPVATEPVSLEEARLQCKVDDDDTTEDALIEAWITAARELAEHFTQRALSAQTLEAAMDAFPSGNGSFDLPMPPVASVTSIKYTDDDGAEQTLDAADYALSQYGHSRTVSLAYGSEWPATQSVPDAVRIRYVAGYTTAPRAVKAALLLMVAWMYAHRGDEMTADDIQPPAAKALLGTVKVWGF